MGWATQGRRAARASHRPGRLHGGRARGGSERGRASAVPWAPRPLRPRSNTPFCPAPPRPRAPLLRPQGFEQVKAIYVESPDNHFTVENDLLTPTFKLKRAPLQKKYQPEIDAM